MIFERVGIVGVGLMGGSLGMALRMRSLAGEVIGVDKNAGALSEARARGAIDRAVNDLPQAAQEADCLVFAAPVGQIPPLLEAAAPHISPKTLVTDLGSVKARIVETGTRLFGTRFVGGHPMAGSERSGVEAARADLFEGAAWAVIASPPEETPTPSARDRLVALIHALDARPVYLQALQHDRLVALVSHLPHLLSFAFARTLRADPEANLARSLAGGSYRDFMRVARSDPALWSDILRQNRAALLEALASYKASVESLENALAAEDLSALPSLLEL